MKIFKHKKVTKKYALKAALHRRLAKKVCGANVTFNESDLVEFFEYESIGIKPCSFDTLKARNGFALGKWLRDVDVIQITEDVEKGDFCKAEFLSKALMRLHNTEFLKNIISPTWFPFLTHNG